MKRGFTLLEIMIAVVVVAIVSSIIISVFSSLNNRQSLDSSAELVKSVLERAQSLTLSSQGDTQYGVHFNASEVILFKGTTYSSTDSNNATTTINPRVTISSLNLNGGGSEVLFNRLTGGTNQYGTTTLSLVSASTTERRVLISQTGNIQSQ
ncbi:prepilin-type N-terminal cleavage/methylation domain-containing protein [Candidatus Parcubacteria bacterium]|nr:prepilin-type N-terminal cleavage/methylation domain-containing protein [Candidatus Parcubacteria bacterium]